MISIELIKEVREYIAARYVDPEQIMRSMAGGFVPQAVPTESRKNKSAKSPLKSLTVDEDLADYEESVCADIPAPFIGSEFFSEFSVGSGLDALLRNADESFGQILLHYIDASGMTDAQCYNKAQISRSHFNKIKNDPDYHVQKETVMAFILALGLDFPAASELLGKAGFAFTNSSKSDLIIRYCIENGIHDVTEVNQLLYRFDQKLLGAGIRE